jgi:hypothetical protein
MDFFPPISLLNISVYRLQPRLFMDSPPYLKKTPKGLNLYVSLIMTLICLDPCQWSLMSLITGNKVKNIQAKVHVLCGFPPPISLLNISVYRLQSRLFMDSPPYLKKTQKDHKEIRFCS